MLITLAQKLWEITIFSPNLVILPSFIFLFGYTYVALFALLFALPLVIIFFLILALYFFPLALLS